MYLQISYQNGDSRLVRLHPVFFDCDKGSINDKVNAIALGNGVYPHKIFLQQDDTVLIDSVNVQNAPREKVSQPMTAKAKRNSLKMKKQAKKEYTNLKFEHRIVFSCVGVLSYSLNKS